MISLFPIMIFGGLFLATKAKPKAKPKAKESSSPSFDLVGSGRIENLPDVKEPPLPMTLSLGQMIEIKAAASPLVTWREIKEGDSVLVDTMVRSQDSVTDIFYFGIKAHTPGISRIVFEKKIIRGGEVIEVRHIQIEVTE